CTHHLAPNSPPATVAAVPPPIPAPAPLLITPSFETYVTTSSRGIHKYNYHMGESATRGLTDMVNASFQHAEVRRVGDADLMQWLSGPADTTVADLLLVPRFDVGGYSQGLFTEASDVRIRLDVRPYRGATTYSFSSAAHTKRALTSLRALTRGPPVDSAPRRVPCTARPRVGRPVRSAPGRPRLPQLPARRPDGARRRLSERPSGAGGGAQGARQDRTAPAGAVVRPDRRVDPLRRGVGA